LPRKDLLVELSSGSLWLYAQLSLQDIHAVLILAQSGRSATLPHIETHEGPVRDLLEGI
jgi:hypothetical protein